MLFAVCAHAEEIIAPNVVVPDEIRPQSPRELIPIQPPEINASMPAGADQIKVQLNSVSIAVAYTELTEATNALRTRLAGKRIKLSRIYQEVRRLEQAYADAGYILMRVIVPPQALAENGNLKLNLVDGFIESIDVSHLPAAAQEAVLARTQSLIHQQPITMRRIERALLLAGDIPGVRLKSTLVRGEQEGAAKLVLECDCQHFGITLGLDNRLDRSLDRWQAVTVVSVNSLSGWQAYGIAGTGGNWSHFFDNQSTLKVSGVGLVVPLGSSGLTLNPEYTASLVRPLAVTGVLRTNGEFERYALRLQYPLIKWRSQKLDIKLGLEHIAQHTEAIDFKTDINRDSYYVARLGDDYQNRLGKFDLQMNATVSQGLGGRDESDVLRTSIPLTRQQSSPEFSKLNIGMRVAYAFDSGFQVNAIGLAQGAFNKPQLRAEQFGWDGKDGLSVFPSGALVTDEGATLRAELSKNISVVIQHNTVLVSPYLFAGGGWGRIIAPTAVEQNHLQAYAWGLGLRTQLFNANRLPASLGFELGEGRSNSDNLPHLWRGSFILFLSY